ncbi:DEAD/DEAH box helicase [Anaeromyxobacter sp. SG17]|uniref:DEAD/DEAH box helicase n=1 Tax=Anaeromyxobacter sp. SG17 TaxID=2925405 RepID=UPI001F58D04E|nr:DEAD/DEAH box helicase [Anaeromyxobacter sp. SG17]
MEPFTVALTPSGHLVLRPGEPVDALGEAVARRIRAALERGHGPGLLHLGAREARTALPPALAFWRDFARAFVAALCAVPDLEERREDADPEPSPGELEQLAASAPPLLGGEYLSPAVLRSLWADTLAAWREEIARAAGTVQAWLAERDPAWSVVGRVHLHLAENRQDPERPFAFLATYTTGLAPSGRPRHRRLGDAVREASSAADRRRLLALLQPVHRASERSPLVKALADSGALFQPLAWTPAEAHLFLREVPALEESGVLVRVPAWWSGRHAPRPRVTMRVGETKPAALGLDALLDFDVRLTLGEAELTEAELRALRAAGSGLVLFKGRWVEIDREQLDLVLKRFQDAQRTAAEGVSFVEAMRLVAGAELGAEVVLLDPNRQWTGVRAGTWLEETLASLRGARGTEEADPGAALHATLRPYQREGVRWLWTLARLGLGGCLADDMGLGKTVQILALLLLLKRRRLLEGPHLLVVPASLLANWKAEAERFAPSLRVLVAHPSATPRETLAALDADALAAHDLVVVTYGAVARLPWATQADFGLAVLDEAQAVKNPAARQSRAVKAIRARVRFALTGTPVENRPGDLWSIFDFVNPGLLGSAKEFAAFLKRTASAAAAPPPPPPAPALDGAAQPSPYAAVRALVRPYLLRRLKTDRAVIADLPAKTEVKAFCALSRAQAALYAESVEALARELAAVSSGDRARRRGVVLAYLLRLKQICNHPSQWLGDGEYAPGASGKFARLAEIAETVASRQEKALVFTQFREMTAPLARFLASAFGRPGLVLHGQTPVKDRAALVRRFQEDETVSFFVLSLKAGGTGLNLTAASHVVHFDRWWNPAVETQATDRAFRIGQRKAVLVHKLVCRGTIEERIDAMLEDKRRLSQELLEGTDEIRLTELDDRELLRLVSLDLRSAEF